MRIALAKRSAPSLLVLSAMLLVVGLAGVQDGIVLCFGGDGHVAIEAVGPEGCAEAAEAGAPVVSAIPISLPHCGPCFDVALASIAAMEGVKAAKRSFPPATFSSPTPGQSILHLRASISYQRDTAFISEKPHTIVIRC